MQLLQVSFVYTLVSLLSCVIGSSIQAIELSDLAMELPGYTIQISNSNLSMLSGPRDYYTLMTLTSTDPKHECELCGTIPGIIKDVANSWYSDYFHTHLLFFVSIDIVDKANFPIFETLELDSVPHVWLIPPNINHEIAETQADEWKILTDGHFVYKFPLASSTDQVLNLAQFLSENIQKSITIKHADETSRFMKTFFVTLSIILLIKKKGPGFITSTRKQTVIAIFFIALTLTFICGYQFTMLQGSPFVATNEKGLIYISGGLHYQFGVEIVLVAVNYAALAMSLLTLIYLGNYKLTSTSKIQQEHVKSGLILLNSMVLYLLYSVLTSMFLRKAHDYPYGFTKLF